MQWQCTIMLQMQRHSYHYVEETVLQYSVKQEVIKDGGRESTVLQEKYEFYLILLKSN